MTIAAALFSTAIGSVLALALAATAAAARITWTRQIRSRCGVRAGR